MIALGVDVGGTFTDLVLADLAQGKITIHKSIPEQNWPSSRCKIGQFGRGLAAPLRACSPDGTVRQNEVETGRVVS
jgi:hypothetical protein